MPARWQSRKCPSCHERGQHFSGGSTDNPDHATFLCENEDCRVDLYIGVDPDVPLEGAPGMRPGP